MSTASRCATRGLADLRGGPYRLLAVTMALSFLLGYVVITPQTALAAPATTTANLNLRTGPSQNNSVVTVIPRGRTVEVTGDAANGYVAVVFNGRSGFVHSDFLNTGGGGADPGADPGAGQGSPSATGSATVTVGLHLRAGPSTADRSLTVMPAGATVTLNGREANGFRSITFNGVAGWAHSSFLRSGGGAPDSGSDGGDDQGSPSATGSATVRVGLNLRAGPSTGERSLTVMPAGASVTLNGRESNGFLSVTFNGVSGWAHSDYLGTGTGAPDDSSNGGDDQGSPSATGSAATTAALHLRAGPSTADRSLAVMPDGATVTLNGRTANSFLSVTYNRLSGWAFGTYLRTGGAPDSGNDGSDDGANDDGNGSVAPGTTVTGTAYVTTSLHLRSGPSTSSGSLTVMRSGAEVQLLGAPRDGFQPLRYNGTAGWAAARYLSDSPPSSPPPSSGNDIISIIYAAADRYGQPRADMLRVARCESGLNPRARNPSSGASGLFQFMPGTWRTTPYAEMDIFDPWASANAAGWMWSVGRRNEWSCQ